MNQDFRERAFLPLIMPLLVAAGFVGVAFALSRVLLAVPEVVATVVGIAVAGYILFVAALISSRPHITSRGLGVGLSLALVGVVTAGVVAAAAGPYPRHEEEVAAGAEGPPAPEQPAVPPDALLFVTDQLAFTQAPPSAPAGDVTVALRNDDGLPHNVVFEGVNNDEPVAEAQGNETATGTVTLEPGTYTYYCSVPGHRQAGMEGQLTVS